MGYRSIAAPASWSTVRKNRQYDEDATDTYQGAAPEHFLGDQNDADGADEQAQSEEDPANRTARCFTFHGSAPFWQVRRAPPRVGAAER